jgi:hypothetical protein
MHAGSAPAQTFSMSNRTLSDPRTELQNDVIGPLWILDDLAAYLHCSDRTAATRVPGFPAALRNLKPVPETPHRFPPMRQPSIKQLKELV